MNRFLACSAAAAASLLLISSAAAHVHLDEPLVRYPDPPDDPEGSTVQKQGPCGLAGEGRTDRITVFQPGETITVQFFEQIYHPGYFRIAFDQDGVDGFINPATGMDINNSPEVLLDHILIGPSEERPAGTEDVPYQVEVTLPDVECDNCTLQLIQVMKEDLNAPLGPGDLYFRCADIVLSADASDAGPDTGTPDAGVDPDPADAGDDNTENPADPNAGVSGGCAVGGGAGAGAGLFLLGLALVALRRRS